MMPKNRMMSRFEIKETGAIKAATGRDDTPRANGYTASAPRTTSDETGGKGAQPGRLVLQQEADGGAGSIASAMLPAFLLLTSPWGRSSTVRPWQVLPSRRSAPKQSISPLRQTEVPARIERHQREAVATGAITTKLPEVVRARTSGRYISSAVAAGRA